MRSSPLYLKQMELGPMKNFEYLNIQILRMEFLIICFSTQIFDSINITGTDVAFNVLLEHIRAV